MGGVCAEVAQAVQGVEGRGVGQAEVAVVGVGADGFEFPDTVVQARPGQARRAGPTPTRGPCVLGKSGGYG